MIAKYTYIQSISSTALPISGKTPISRKKKKQFFWLNQNSIKTKGKFVPVLN
jgi:hypothetical protein